MARARRRWIREQGFLDPAHLVFIDETAVSTNMVRLNGWNRRGERLVSDAPMGHWETVTFIAGLRNTGIVAPMLIKGAMNGEAFLAYIKQCLVSTLKRKDIVVADNVPFHKVAGVEEAIQLAGASLRYPQQYSPDLNPIELLFHPLKTCLRKAPQRTIEDRASRRSYIRTLNPTECMGYSNIRAMNHHDRDAHSIRYLEGRVRRISPASMPGQQSRYRSLVLYHDQTVIGATKDTAYSQRIRIEVVNIKQFIFVSVVNAQYRQVATLLRNKVRAARNWFKCSTSKGGNKFPTRTIQFGVNGNAILPSFDSQHGTPANSESQKLRPCINNRIAAKDHSEGIPLSATIRRHRLMSGLKGTDQFSVQRRPDNEIEARRCAEQRNNGTSNPRARKA